MKGRRAAALKSNCNVGITVTRDCGAEAQAIFDGWGWSQKLLDGGAGYGPTAMVCGASELYK